LSADIASWIAAVDSQFNLLKHSDFFTYHQV
jgi:hypothetical protein